MFHFVLSALRFGTIEPSSLAGKRVQRGVSTGGGVTRREVAAIEVWTVLPWPPLPRAMASVPAAVTRMPPPPNERSSAARMEARARGRSGT
jgi:hypothetical protein